LKRTLSSRSHEGDQRVTDGLLHGVSGGAIEGEVVDHGPNHYTSPHELTDGVAHVLIIAAEAINPTDHKHITGPQLVEQAATLGALDKASVEARHAVVSNYLVDDEACRFRVGELVFDGLLCGRYSRLKNGRHDMPLRPLGSCPHNLMYVDRKEP